MATPIERVTISLPEAHAYQKSSLLRLPPELRTIIWSQIAAPDDNLYTIGASNLWFTLSCRQIYHEAHLTAFRATCFRILRPYRSIAERCQQLPLELRKIVETIQLPDMEGCVDDDHFLYSLATAWEEMGFNPIRLIPFMPTWSFARLEVQISAILPLTLYCSSIKEIRVQSSIATKAREIANGAYVSVLAAYGTHCKFSPRNYQIMNLSKLGSQGWGPNGHRELFVVEFVSPFTGNTRIDRCFEIRAIVGPDCGN